MSNIDDTVGKLARVYDSQTDTWIPLIGSPTPHVHNISTSADVDITEPLTDNEILEYSASASAFINTASPTFTELSVTNNISSGSVSSDSISSDFVSVSDTASINDIVVTGKLSVEELTERVETLTLTSNSASPSFNDGNIFYISASPSANFSLDLQDVPTDNNKVITFSFLTVQGSTGRIPSTLSIGGSSQTIRWVGGVTPTPTSSSGKIDIFVFSLLRLSNSWIVLASTNLNI